jgi:hypothetical protein
MPYKPTPDIHAAEAEPEPEESTAVADKFKREQLELWLHSMMEAYRAKRRKAALSPDCT